ncbi:MAG: CoA-binding protein [Candidatus Lokiarchaeota archaeon]|nr:CoA-binding protein [Candidatus Lokiarchaeota archaeon]
MITLKSETSNNFDLMFNPKTVMFYGANPKTSFFISGFIRQNYDLNNLYLVSSKLDTIMDIKCYKTVDEVPAESFDLVILSVRRSILIETLEDILLKKKVKFFHIFTAGTGEADDIGVEIESQLKKILNQHSDTRAIGPNCMGIYSPKGKIAYYSSFPVEIGNIGLIFQSGDLHSKMVKFGSRRYDLRFSKGVSVGNCVDIQISELLEYFNEDIDIDIICVYQEGFSPFYKEEGKSLFDTLKKMKKPVLYIRGGKTLRGQTAVLTHTGAIATSENIWRAIFKQTPTIEVTSSLDDLIDYTYMFFHYFNYFKKNNRPLVYPDNKRALVILWSGGFGILATDTLTELGIELPHFTGDKLAKLEAIYPATIGSLANPFDLPWVTSRKEFLDVCKTAIDKNIDLVILETDAWSDLNSDRFKGYYHNISEIKKHVESHNKVFIIILHDYPSESRKQFYEMLIADNFLVYPNLFTAAQSFLKLYEYGQKQKKLRNF